MSHSNEKFQPRQSVWAPLLVLILWSSTVIAAPPVAVKVDWSRVERVSRTTATLQVVVNPLLRRGSPIHNQVFQDLKELKCDYVRYVPWLPYPKLAVAELEPPENGKTSWNFSLIDPMTEDFMNATAGHSVILNFSTIPQWMFKTPKPVPYPVNPDQVDWRYEQGTELRDPSMKEVADYYARLVSWYTKGGFTDEYGKRHESGHYYKIAYWEVLNEVDSEHKMSPEFYTHIYDAIVTAIRKVDPQMKFVGLALAGTSPSSSFYDPVPEYFEYFLNHKNHKPGVPLDMISYHFYASPYPDESVDAWPYTFFSQADGFLDQVRYIEAIRKRLSPETKTTIDEMGSILPNDNVVPRKPIPDSYWNLCAAMYAYLYARLSLLGINVAGESQLVGYPSQFPSVSMVNWETGQLNARGWVLKLLRDNFGPGDKLVPTSFRSPAMYAQGFLTPAGEHKVLLINKRNRDIEITLPGGAQATEEYVDQSTGDEPPASVRLTGDTIILKGFAVAVVTLPQ
ncbi:MAG: glycosyl hydrolase family 39 [Acidobacteria bacterium]|nr:glycosyl hydrolase family 39 [Acidobacteriota bacterium]